MCRTLSEVWADADSGKVKGRACGARLEMQGSQKRCPHGSTSGFRSTVGATAPSTLAAWDPFGPLTAAATSCARSSGESSASPAAAPARNSQRLHEDESLCHSIVLCDERDIPQA